MIVPNVIIPYDGTHASIPSGYSRDTRFDGRFPKGSNTGAGGLAGADTHTHRFNHNHTIAAHQHKADVHNERDAQRTWTANRNPDGACTGHDHDYAQTGTAQTQATGTTNALLNAKTNDPPYYKVIFIKSNSYNSIPKNGIMFVNATSRPGMTYHLASQNRWLKGSSTGANAGGTGGASSHLHSQSHTHTATNHGHNQGELWGYIGDSAQGGTRDAEKDGQGHGNQHKFNVVGAKQNMNSNTSNSSTKAVVPVNRTLRHYYAVTPQIPIPGDIAMTTGAVPLGWKLCNGTDGTPNMHGYFLKNSTSPNVTGGANTHNHAHTHGHSASGTHTHGHDQLTAFSLGSEDGYHIQAAVPTARLIGAHRHEILTFNSIASSYNSKTVTATTVANQPKYVSVKFIQFEYSTVGGSFIFNLL